VANEPTPSEGSQRAYRAACPSCGAPVEFRSAASALAVCSFCRSTLVRDGEALRRIGVSAELFDDHSPLQLGAAGRWQGAAFTLVGRLQVRYAGGSWNEWHALFDGDAEGPGKSGWLSEDNGAYVFGFEAEPPGPLPPPEALKVGTQQVLGRDAWSVASVTTAKLGAAEGELPFVPNLQRAYVVAELRNAQDEVASIDYGPVAEGKPPRWYVGRGLQLASLALTGLRKDGSKQLAGRSVECPSCGASLEVKLTTTQSIACHQCHAVVDVSQRVGADLQHYAQETPGEDGRGGGEPLIPLGRSGTLALGAGGPLPWQVVGYVERCTLPEPGDEDEQSFWREYLLYNRTAGFAFLVDAEDGWSWVRPLTGAPTVSGSSARWQGEHYQELYRYRGRITYVLGEFYWKLERGQVTVNTDYRGPGGKQLNREQTGDGGQGDPDSEVTWSAGSALDADVLIKAFRLADTPQASMKRDAAPISVKSGSLAGLFVFLLVVVVIFSMVRCSRDDCDSLRRTYGEASNEYQQCKRSGGGGVRTGGGSFGGFSTGGGHK